MDFGKVFKGMKYLVAIFILLCIDVAVVIKWADAIFPNILPLTDVGFWDAFPMIGLTLLFGWLTCEIAEDLSTLVED